MDRTKTTLNDIIFASKKFSFSNLIRYDLRPYVWHGFNRSFSRLSWIDLLKIKCKSYLHQRLEFSYSQWWNPFKTYKQPIWHLSVLSHIEEVMIVLQISWDQIKFHEEVILLLVVLFYLKKILLLITIFII